MRSLLGDFFDSDGSDASCHIDIDELFRGRILPGNQHVAEQYRKWFIALKISCNQHGVPQAKRLFLARVTDLNHVADLANHGGLVLFSFLLQEALESGRVIEVILDGILSDRKSTRLNSSHMSISYAVFCLKK